MRLALVALVPLLLLSTAATGTVQGPVEESRQVCSEGLVAFCLTASVSVEADCESSGEDELLCFADITWVAEGTSAPLGALPGEVRRFAEAWLTVCGPGDLCLTTIITLVDDGCVFGPQEPVCRAVTSERFDSLPLTLSPGECATVEARGLHAAWLWSLSRRIPGNEPLLSTDVGPTDTATVCV